MAVERTGCGEFAAFSNQEKLSRVAKSPMTLLCVLRLHHSDAGSLAIGVIPWVPYKHRM
jgi:hypothetical protein